MAQRLDKWLVYARFVKHRSAAVNLIENGQVRINRDRAQKPSQTVKANDVLTLALAGRVKVVKVLGEAERRGPAASVAALYEDMAAQPATQTAMAEKQDAQAAPLC